VTTAMLRRWGRLIVLALLVPLASACEIAPEPVHLGAEECAHCSMLISERRYAAQLLTTKGKAYKFDAIECLREFLATGAVSSADVHSLWVTDATLGEGWIRAEDATFLHSAELRTPMGGGLAAYASAADAQVAAARLSGTLMSWQALLAADLPGGGHDHAGHDHEQSETAHDQTREQPASRGAEQGHDHGA
jgi:copper chaperone NosL